MINYNKEAVCKLEKYEKMQFYIFWSSKKEYVWILDREWG